VAREHAIIRNADVNAVRLIEVSDSGYFTQATMGRGFRALDAEGRPRDVAVGERLWVAQSGRGVIAECEIADLPPAVLVTDLMGIERLRKRAELTGFAPKYWDELRDRLLRSPGKTLFVSPIGYRCRHRLAPADIFRLNKAGGRQHSWFTFDPGTPDGLLAFRGQPVVTGDTTDLANYGKITDKVRNLVFQVWGATPAIPAMMGESIDFDHWVPKSLGGPGIYVENVLPLPKRANIRKSAHVGVGFLHVSKRLGLLLPEDEALDWALFPRDPETGGAKAKAVRRVTSAVRDWPVVRQRAFYFAVLAYTVQDLAERFSRAGLPVPEPL
jgi:hypothetical protein